MSIDQRPSLTCAGPRTGRASHLATLVVFAFLAAPAVSHDTALAVVPPFAEEWPTVGGPQDVEVDPSGRIWVSCDDDSIRVYTPTGGQLLFAFGGSGGGDGEFQTPYGMAFDPGGNVYVCDYLGARVEKFDGDGVFLLSWPIPSTHADHVAVDGAGDVYVAGYSDLSVHKYTSTGSPLLDWASNGGTQTSGVLEVGGTVFVVQWNAPVVETFDTDGQFLGSFAASTLGGTDIEADLSFQLWVADFNNNVIRSFTTDGTPVDVLGAPGAGPGEFNGAIGIAVGPDGSIYVADQYNYRVQRFGESVVAVPGGAPEAPGIPGAPQAAAAGSSSLEFRSVAPNPSRGPVEIRYVAPRESPHRLTVTDVSGRAVATLFDGLATGGEHRVVWSQRREDGRRFPAGAYFLRLSGADGVRVARVAVVK